MKVQRSIRIHVKKDDYLYCSNYTVGIVGLSASTTGDANSTETVGLEIEACQKHIDTMTKMVVSMRKSVKKAAIEKQLKESEETDSENDPLYI